jgi:cytochrome c-type biogenesis protein CcmH
MTVLLFAIFAGLALAAVSFAAWPLLRGGRSVTGWILAAAIGSAVLGIGCGTYLILGSPQIALRTLAGYRQDDLKSIVAELVANARAHPQDAEAWTMLGRGYLTVRDGQDAALAFRRALLLAPPPAQPALLSALGESLTIAAQGVVTPDAEAALNAAVRADPHDLGARYYLGLAAVQRHDNARALAYWQSMLADAPPNAPWRGPLLDRIAMLSASAPAPDIAAMVAGLDARLHAQPNDPDGWLRLVRAYSVLDDGAKAQAALHEGRIALKSNPQAEAALQAEAKQLGLLK